MKIWDSDKSADSHKTARDADADAQIAALKNGSHNGSSAWGFGRGGRASTARGLEDLGDRVVKDADAENRKGGGYGLFGAKFIASKASRAQRGDKL